jgi:hypothetical protein
VKDLSITKVGSTMRIDGFPRSIAFVEAAGRKAKRVADLTRHRLDLIFARDCLSLVQFPKETGNVSNEALWRSAIIHFAKCFGRSSGRGALSDNAIYKSKQPEARIAFTYFRDLRNKHLVHDDNPFVQSVVGAVLNPLELSPKIEAVLSIGLQVPTLDSSSESPRVFRRLG